MTLHNSVDVSGKLAGKLLILSSEVRSGRLSSIGRLKTTIQTVCLLIIVEFVDVCFRESTV